MHHISLLAVTPLATLARAAALQSRVPDTNIGLTPAMGWSSWVASPFLYHFPTLSSANSMTRTLHNVMLRLSHMP